MIDQFEDFYIATPQSFACRHFMYGIGSQMEAAAIVHCGYRIRKVLRGNSSFDDLD